MVRLREERSRSPSGVLVGDVANLLYRFALEGRGDLPSPLPYPTLPIPLEVWMLCVPRRHLLYPL